MEICKRKLTKKGLQQGLVYPQSEAMCTGNRAEGEIGSIPGFRGVADERLHPDLTPSSLTRRTGKDVNLR